MPRIDINSCHKVSNHDALRAVVKFMDLNYAAKNYKCSRDVSLGDGKVIQVIESPSFDSSSPCSCSFEVKNSTT